MSIESVPRADAQVEEVDPFQEAAERVRVQMALRDMDERDRIVNAVMEAALAESALAAVRHGVDEASL